MPKTTKPPAYRLHKRTGQAVISLDGKDHYLGPHGFKASREAYDELISRWLANGRRLPETPTDPLAVSELLIRFYRHGRQRYGNRLTAGKRLSVVRSALGSVIRLFGSTRATEFGPKALMFVRGQYIEAGMARMTVNERVQVVRACFKWAVREELIPASVHHGLIRILVNSYRLPIFLSWDKEDHDETGITCG